ncbi:MAG: tetratricopeptide repeat protein, partial [Bacteroidales bacterium]|nr:tetratricopeptide repeat protein [Bacteroidales bacterium]
KKAQQSYTEAVNSNPKYAYAYCDRAAVHIKTGNYKAALDDYETALHIMPSESYIYVLRAWAKTWMNNFSGAISDVNTAILMDREKELEYLNERANIYSKFKKYKLATDDFKNCIAKNPGFADTYINMGNMFMEQKKYAEAEKYYTLALEKDSFNIAAYNNRANAKELQFDLKGAASDRQIAENLLKQLK